MKYHSNNFTMPLWIGNSTKKFRCASVECNIHRMDWCYDGEIASSGEAGNPSIWWCHQMETFSASLAPCAGNSPVTGEFPTQRPLTRSFDVFFDLRLNKRLSKQSWGWWFETPLHPLWRHCNESKLHDDIMTWKRFLHYKFFVSGIH